MPEQGEFFYNEPVTRTMKMLPKIKKMPDLYPVRAIGEAEEMLKILTEAKEVALVARDPQRTVELREKASELCRAVDKRSQEILKLLAPLGFLTSDPGMRRNEVAGFRGLNFKLPYVKFGRPDLEISATLEPVREDQARDLPFVVVYEIDYSKRREEREKPRPRQFTRTIHYAPREIELAYVDDGLLTRLGITFSPSLLNVKTFWLAKGEGAWQVKDGQTAITHFKEEKEHCEIDFGGPLFDEPRFITQYTPQYLRDFDPLPRIRPLGPDWEKDWLAAVRWSPEMWAMRYALASVCTEEDFTTVPREIVQRHKDRGTLVFPTNTVDNKTPGHTIVTFKDPLDVYPPVGMLGKVPLYVEG